MGTFIKVAENFDVFFKYGPVGLFTCSVVMQFLLAYKCILKGKKLHKGKLIFTCLLAFASYTLIECSQSMGCVQPSATVMSLYEIYAVLMISLAIILLFIAFIVLQLGGKIKTDTLILIFLFIMSAYIANGFSRVYEIPSKPMNYLNTPTSR